MNLHHTVVSALSILLAFTAVSSATVTTLNASKDDFVYSGAPTSTGDGFDNLGLDTFFDAGIYKQRDLVQFNLSSIPTGSTINSATFSVIGRTTRINYSFEVYRVTTAWDATGKASWNNKSQDTDNSPTIQIPWTNAGGDFVN